MQGVLERANIKLASVATDIMGVSARAILTALVEGRADPATMAELAKRRMRSKIPLLEQALTGLVRDHHRQLLAMQLAHIDFLDEQIEALSAEIMHRLAALSGDMLPVASPGPTGEADSAATPATADTSMTFARAVTLLDTIPGVNQRGGELLVAEWGIDMGRFGTDAPLAAWSGVAPGNNESTGKLRSGKRPVSSNGAENRVKASSLLNRFFILLKNKRYMDRRNPASLHVTVAVRLRSHRKRPRRRHGDQRATFMQAIGFIYLMIDGV